MCTTVPLLHNCTCRAAAGKIFQITSVMNWRQSLDPGSFTTHNQHIHTVVLPFLLATTPPGLPQSLQIWQYPPITEVPRRDIGSAPSSSLLLLSAVAAPAPAPAPAVVAAAATRRRRDPRRAFFAIFFPRFALDFINLFYIPLPIVPPLTAQQKRGGNEKRQKIWWRTKKKSR